MRFALFALLFVSLSLFLFQDVNAFTVGNLLPSYICGPTDLNLNPLDNLPKSLGGWLPNVMRLTNPLVNGTPAVATVRVDFATDQGTVANTQGLITNWHNRATIVPCQKTIFTTTALTKTATITNQIVPGQNHTLTLTINGKDGNPLCDVNTAASQETATDIANIALDGAVVFAMDANAARVGTFLAFGANENQVTTMQPWAACGANNLGIVHNQLISGTGQYTGIIWQAPATLVPGTTLTFLGAAVSDVGFGKHISGIPVMSPTAAAAAGATLNVATPVITKVAEAGKNLAVFFNSQANNAPAANALIIPTKFTVTATSGATTKTVTVNAHNTAALVPITADMKGQTFTVTVTASNNQAKVLPTTSAPFVFTLPAGQVQQFIDLNMVLGLCPADVQNQRANFKQEADPDFQCAYQTQSLIANGTVAFIQQVSAAQSVHQSPVLTLQVSALFAVILATFARYF